MKEKINALIEEIRKDNSEAFTTEYERQMLENLVDYAYNRYGHSKGSAKYMLAEIIPWMDYDVLDACMPDFAIREAA